MSAPAMKVRATAPARASSSGATADTTVATPVARKAWPQPIGPTGAVRVTLRLTYRNAPWATIPLEVSPVEGRSGDPAAIDYRRPAPDLSVFGLEPQGDVPCLPVRYQIAQKLHACTEATTNKENDRFRDLIDLLLLEELVGECGWPDVRSACLEVFALRPRHTWPPAITVSPAWPVAGVF